MPLWLYFLSFLFCSVLFLNSNFICNTSVSCVWFKTRTVHFVFSLRIFVSAHVLITSITAPGMLTNLCLVLLLLFADSPAPKFHFQLKKKKEKKKNRWKVPEKVGHKVIWQTVTKSVPKYALSKTGSKITIATQNNEKTTQLWRKRPFNAISFDNYRKTAEANEK